MNIGGKKLLIQLNRSFEKKCSVNNLREIKIAIDAMGGDFGPSVVINGAYLALKKNPNLKFVLIHFMLGPIDIKRTNGIWKGKISLL